ncbi:tetratricopeptide repeat protein [Verrucomicrobia bacterium]|nr:tetratricopeptide repeat protein [Verrucomicrobiota bacterium]MDA7657844.1 tetratricopeptide repeat protein [Verrucomicrobiota bacterium]MDB4746257.1 tetratricopeptide repeat protein [Verrucomicrobiota bacterium]
MRLDRLSSRIFGGISTLALLFSLFSFAQAADQIETPFDSANILYEQGKYEEAAIAYRQIIAEGSNSAAVRFNLGNALYQAGQIGSALGEYHQALGLAPRDPDIQANIRFTREKLGTSAVIPRSFWQRILLQLTLNEWTFIALIPFWIWIVASAISFLIGEKRTSVSGIVKGAGISFLVMGLLMFNAANERLGKTYAVVTAKEAVVRFGPFEESKSSHNLADGIEIQLVGHKEGWHQIRDPQDQIGWLRQDQILTLQPHP